MLSAESRVELEQQHAEAAYATFGKRKRELEWITAQAPH
jgi:hypothetical protein